MVGVKEKRLDIEKTNVDVEKQILIELLKDVGQAKSSKANPFKACEVIKIRKIKTP